MLLGSQSAYHRYGDLYYYLALTVIFVSLKFAFSHMQTDNLRYFLMPLDKIVTLATNSNSRYITGQGYYHQQFNILIDKSCSGFNFFILCFTMLGAVLIQRTNNQDPRRRSLLGLFITAYILSIFVNSARIISSLFLQSMDSTFSFMRSALLHQAEGIFIYLCFLIIIYSIFNSILPHRATDHE